ncbi:MAG: glycosyltransferase family A protein [Candidatus Nealsonbacteria bacterium]
MMTFSLIIPAYNEQSYIEKCLKSVKFLKIPSGESLEVIVVNNASTDKTEEVARMALPEAKIIREPKKGLTRAYNRGAIEAKGEILIFVDADTILSPDHLEKLSREFAKEPKLVALSGPCAYRDGGKFCEAALFFTYLFLATPAEIIFNRWLNIGASIVTGNSAVKKEAFDKIGGFNENIFYGLEPEFGRRIRKLGRVRFKRRLGAESSARRFKKEGVFLILGRYTMDNICQHLFKKSFPRDYIDIR